MTSQDTALHAADATSFSISTDPELPQSPSAMANAVMQEAMEERLTQDLEAQEAEVDSNAAVSIGVADHTSVAGNKRSIDLINQCNNHVDPQLLLQGILDSSQPDEEKHEAIVEVALESIDSLLKQGLKAFHANESSAREMDMMKEELEAKERELQRLRAADLSSRTTIANLLRAVEASKTDARESSRNAQIEAKLRSQIASLRGDRDQISASVNDLKRKITLQEEEVRIMRAKLTKTEQDKLKIERDSRAAISLAKSGQEVVTSDVSFYKTKVQELQNQLSAQHALVAEQKSQIEDMRRQQERSMSQNRLASLNRPNRKSF